MTVLYHRRVIMSEIFKGQGDAHRKISEKQQPRFTDQQKTPLNNSRATLIRICIALILLFVGVVGMTKWQSNKNFAVEVDRQAKIMLAADSKARQQFEKEKQEYIQKTTSEFVVRTKEWQASVDGYKQQHDRDQQMIEDLKAQLEQRDKSILAKERPDLRNYAEILSMVLTPSESRKMEQIALSKIDKGVGLDSSDTLYTLVPDEPFSSFNTIGGGLIFLATVSKSSNENKTDMLGRKYIVFIRKGDTEPSFLLLADGNFYFSEDKDYAWLHQKVGTGNEQSMVFVFENPNIQKIEEIIRKIKQRFPKRSTGINQGIYRSPFVKSDEDDRLSRGWGSFTN